jgi:hypothetical protein
MDDLDRTASLMTPAKLAQVRPKGPASPAAWLDQMAADAGHAHVRRLAELRKELQAQAMRRDCSPLTAGLTRLGEALPRLDFGLLRSRGWWARTTGKSRSAGVEFASVFEQADEAALALAAQTQDLVKKQQDRVAAGDRALVELEVEFRALDTIIGQGARWLQDMRAQLKARQAQAADEPGRKQIKDDAARCEILVARLKALRGVTSAAQHSHQQAQGAAARGAAVLQTLQRALTADVKSWRARLSLLAAAAGDSDSPALNLEEPQENHRALQLCVKQILADCAQLQAQEKLLADSLAALGEQLEAVVSR